MRVFRWLARTTCYTFAVSLISVLAGQVASLYGFFFFYGYVFIQGDAPILQILQTKMMYVLALTLAFSCFTHYVCFGLLRAFRLRCELRRLRIINDHVCDTKLDSTLSSEELRHLLHALSRIPLWNTVTAGILSLPVALSQLFLVVSHGGSVEEVFLGIRASFVAVLVYLYITYVITDFLTASLRSQIKKAIHQRGERFEETHLFSLKGKFASFVVFMLVTLVVINSLTLGTNDNLADNLIIALFSFLSLVI